MTIVAAVVVIVLWVIGFILLINMVIEGFNELNRWED